LTASYFDLGIAGCDTTETKAMTDATTDAMNRINELIAGNFEGLGECSFAHHG